MCRANGERPSRMPAPPAPNTVCPRARLQKACCASPSMQASQPNSGRLGDFCPQTHPACLTPCPCHRLPTSLRLAVGTSELGGRKGTFDPARLARLKGLGITCFGLFRGPVLEALLLLVSTEADQAYHTANTTHTYGVAIQRAAPNVCDDTSECPHGVGHFGVTPSPGLHGHR